MSSSLVKLSASRIKTLQTCSWLYYASYILKIPDDSNDGAKRGTICHLVFECCLRDRHQHYVKNIIHNYEKKKILPLTIERLVLKNAKKLNVFDDTNLKMIREMIYIGINYDFLCQGSEQLEPEIEFDYNNGKYHIGGFIDKRVKYKDKTVIWDYKTSKEKFDKKEINSSIQNLMYCLASWKESNQIPQLNFLFLRFPSDPVQVAPRPTPEELKGFEYYLETYLSFYKISMKKRLALILLLILKKKLGFVGLQKNQIS
jgi:ATP-dependent helicase/DNAse subunit B